MNVARKEKTFIFSWCESTFLIIIYIYYFWNASDETLILKQKWVRSDDKLENHNKKELWWT